MLCGKAVKQQHWSDVDSQHLLLSVQRLLTQTFASAPCIDLLAKYASWLKSLTAELQRQLSSHIMVMRVTQEQHFCLNQLCPHSYDPVTIVLLESKRKAYHMLSSPAAAAADGDIPLSSLSPLIEAATAVSNAPISPAPSQVISPCYFCCCPAPSNASMHTVDPVLQLYENQHIQVFQPACLELHTCYTCSCAAG